jgi:nucleoid DNA-binding protein
LTLPYIRFTLEAFQGRIGKAKLGTFSREIRHVTKKEIVKQIADEIGLTQLQTKEIVQKTFDAIVETLIRETRIELRNFGVFEVRRRKARKARNPRTGEKVDVEPKNVVTFKPGKEMEERVRHMKAVPEMGAGQTEAVAAAVGNGQDDYEDGVAPAKTKARRAT